MSRAIPLDELLLQLAESLKKSMQLAAAEVWTGTGGVLECAASVPFREPPRIRLNDDEVDGRRPGARVGQRVAAGLAARRCSPRTRPQRCGSRRSRTPASCSA